MFDRRLAGLRQSAFGPSLAMHVGLHVIIEGGREYVVEQLFETPSFAELVGRPWRCFEHGFVADGMRRCRRPRSERLTIEQLEKRLNF
jgi:hypothetical protein